MQARRKTAALKQPHAADPAVHLCIVALLRVISRQQWSGEEIPDEILVFLASLARPGDLLSSFGKGGQRRLAEKALLNPEDEDDDQLNLEGGGLALRRLMRRRRSATSLLTTPTSSVLRATRSAAPLVIQNLAQTLLSQWEQAEVVASTDWLEGNVRILQRLFALSQAEVATARLAFAFQCVKGQSETISNAVKEAFYCRSARAQSMMKLAHAIGCPPQDLSDVFSSTAPLRTSGLLCNVAVTSYDLDDVLLLSELGQMFASEPFENEESVRQRILTPLVLESTQALVFTHLETQRRDIDSLIDGAIQTGTAGVNVLLYGQPGTGKTEFAKKLARDLRVACYQVGFTSESTGMDASRDDRLSFLKLANRLILPEERAMILLDEAEDIFDSMGSEGNGGRSRRRGSKAWMNALLETMRIPSIWITNDIEFDGAHLRRFTYVAEFAVPPISVRREIVRSQTAGLPIAEATITKLARNDALTPAMLGTAAQFVRLAKPADTDVDAALVRHVEASQRALDVAPSGSVVEGETEFDPRFVNLDSTITVENLVGALRRTGRAGLLFYGPPGSGKTQLANYLARQLDREIIYRTGSDLLNKYVGGTEQLIARLFRSCDAEREMIFLDEAEGLLGSREGAQRSWEVTQVNEFLRQIEQFKGIFIAATNHLVNLDAALMRRFAFRLGFKPLTLEQRLAMFCEMARCPVDAVTADYCRMEMLDGLTAGDFANARRRLVALSREVTPECLWHELQIEQQIKPGSSTQKMGFV